MNMKMMIKLMIKLMITINNDIPETCKWKRVEQHDNDYEYENDDIVDDNDDNDDIPETCRSVCQEEKSQRASDR